VAVRVRTLVETMIEDLIDANAAIPDGSTPRNGEHITSPGLSMALKAALHTAMRNAGMTKSELARVMEKDEKEVRRLLDPRHRSGIASAQAAFDALGVSPRIAA
jgi:antitoxin HicB